MAISEMKGLGWRAIPTQLSIQRYINLNPIKKDASDKGKTHINNLYSA